MNRLFAVFFAIGICLVPITGVLVSEPILAQSESEQTDIKKLVDQALKQTKQGQFQDAIITWQKILTLARQFNDRRLEALILLSIGANNASLGQYQQALDYFNQTLILVREIKEREIEAVTLNNIGKTYFSIGQSQNALNYYQQALTISKEVNNRAGEATSLNSIGGIYGEIGQPQKALDYLQQALIINKEVNDRAGEADTLNNIGVVYHNIGQPQKALDYLQQALPIRKEVGDRAGEAISLNSIGGIYGEIGQPQKALDYLQQALPICKEVGDRNGEATTLNNIGSIYSDIGKKQEALIYYQQALTIHKEVNNFTGESNTLNNIGVVYNAIGKPQKALDYLQQALLINKKIGDRAGEATTFNNIGEVYLGIGQQQKTLDYLQQSLTIFKEVNDRAGEATTLNNIGEIHFRSGQQQKALGYYQKALTIFKEVNDRAGEATTLNNIGLVYYDVGEQPKALQYYQQALPIFKDIKDQFGEAIILYNIGKIYAGISQNQEALDYLSKALLLFREVNNPVKEANTLGGIGAAYSSLNQPLNAIENLEESAKILLQLREELKKQDRTPFLTSTQDTASFLTLLLIQQKQPEKAYEWINRFTTFELANYNLLINAKVANPTAQIAIDNWNQQQQAINFLRQQLKDNYSPEKARQLQTLEAESFKQAEAIAKTYPEAAELFETKATDIQQLRQNIAADTLIIHPVLLTNTKNVANAIALFLLTRQQLKVIVIPIDPQKLDQLLQTYKSQLNGDFKNATDFINTSSQLYNLLIRPIEKQIQTLSPKKLAIITTGKLRGIPFESLYDEKADQYLIEKYPIHYLTRISTAKLSPQSSQPDLKILAIANPRPTKTDLPGTEQQANYITQNFPNSQQYSREQATLTTFKDNSPKFPILHLGTHGCFQRQGCPTLNMEANTLLFADGEKYNIADAALLGLKDTQLIVFSACQTAKEIDENDQSLPGLAYIFERAGAKSIIATLWNSEDNTSVEIMSQFYTNLKQGMSKSEALQKAKLSQIKRHPAFWSVFVLIGED
jgi:CHAT domain-containing protein/Tfp pilus assembly protein PilF